MHCQSSYHDKPDYFLPRIILCTCTCTLRGNTCWFDNYHYSTTAVSCWRQLEEQYESERWWHAQYLHRQQSSELTRITQYDWRVVEEQRKWDGDKFVTSSVVNWNDCLARSSWMSNKKTKGRKYWFVNKQNPSEEGLATEVFMPSVPSDWIPIAKSRWKRTNVPECQQIQKVAHASNDTRSGTVSYVTTDRSLLTCRNGQQGRHTNGNLSVSERACSTSARDARTTTDLLFRSAHLRPSSWSGKPRSLDPYEFCFLSLKCTHLYFSQFRVLWNEFIEYEFHILDFCVLLKPFHKSLTCSCVVCSRVVDPYTFPNVLFLR
jgi:hypothetical protein